MSTANINIKLEWQRTPLDVDATEPAMLGQQQLRRVNFLDLDIRFVSSHGSAAFEIRIYRKPGDACAYLPYGSYHARHVFGGWLKAEMQRLLTHSSCLSVWLQWLEEWLQGWLEESVISLASSQASVWLQERSIFYAHLRNRGYRARAFDSCF